MHFSRIHGLSYTFYLLSIDVRAVCIETGRFPHGYVLTPPSVQLNGDVDSRLGLDLILIANRNSWN